MRLQPFSLIHESGGGLSPTDLTWPPSAAAGALLRIGQRQRLLSRAYRLQTFESIY
jgi:hypothetical protein